MSKATVLITERERLTHGIFTACMWVLSHPGRIQRLRTAGDAYAPPAALAISGSSTPMAQYDAFVAIAQTLLDLETSYYTPDAALDREFARTGARQLPPEQAMYQFYPALSVDALEKLKAAPVGSYEYPDNSATLIVGCTFGTGPDRRWRGPGIDGEVRVAVGGVPEELWIFRQQAVRYPLGWDLLLVAGDLLMGLPRATLVEV